LGLPIILFLRKLDLNIHFCHVRLRLIISSLQLLDVLLGFLKLGLFLIHDILVRLRIDLKEYVSLLQRRVRLNGNFDRPPLYVGMTGVVAK
jgi:hypothetical protein